jgi:predicted nucleic acid-binding protein
MMLDYIDSVILIYHYEAGPFQARAVRWLAASAAAGDELAISDLVRMECRVGPLRSGATTELAMLEGFFLQPDVRKIPLNSAVFDRAAQIRATHGFKTPDAIHLAAAIESGCDRFLTNDARLARFTGLAVEILP